MPKLIDITGQRFGKLVVVERAKNNKYNQAMWHCVCDCGATKEINGNSLKCGSTASCGCLNKENIRERQTKNLSGRKYGRLSAIKIVRHYKGMAVWLCKCDCGQTIEVNSGSLLSGNTKSCGCLSKELSAENMNVAVKLNRLNDWKEGTSLKKIQSKRYKNNQTGVKGVSKNSKNGKYRAEIQIKKVSYYLGEYKSIEEAAEARAKAEQELFNPILEKYGIETVGGE